MNITIVKDFPIGIKEQIKRQIKALIEDQTLTQGQMLLSAKELAKHTGIHQNTAAAIYKELESQSIVSIIKGSGTFVAKGVTTEDRSGIRRIFNAAYDRALESGYDAQSIRDCFITGLLEKSKAWQKGKKALLVDCDYAPLTLLDQKIKETLDIDSHFMMIQDIQTLPGRFLKRIKTCDMVVCNINCLKDLKAAVPDIPIEIIGFATRTSARIIQQLLQLCPGTAAGFCCTSKQSAESFFSGLTQSVDDRVQKIYAEMDNMDQINRMIQTSSIVFATHFVFDLLKEKGIPTAKITRVPVEIDTQHLDFIRSKLQKDSRT